MDVCSNFNTYDEAKEKEIKTILQSIALTKGKILERRREIRKSLVIAALDNIELQQFFTISDIANKIEEIGKCKIAKEEIVAVLDDFVEEGNISHSDEYRYILNKKIELPEIEVLTQPVWVEFSTILKRNWSKYDPFLHKKVRVVFDSVLMKILTRYALSKPLENEIDYIPIENIRYVIQNEISLRAIEGEFGKKLFENLLDYFTSENKELLNCIVNCYFWFIDLNLLSFEKNLAPVNFSDETNYLLLDTNFIVTILCKTDVKFPLSISLIEFCKKSKIPLYYSDMTKDEVWKLVNASKSEMKLDPNRTYRMNNQFLDDYRHQNTINGIHYSEYIILMNKWIESLEEKYQIKMLPTQFSKNYDKKDFEYIKNTLPMLYDVQAKERSKRNVDYRIRVRSEDTFIHDAYCISLISFVKKNPNIFLTKKTLGPWFLTYDYLVSDLNNHYFRKNDDFGYVIQPRILLNYFLAFSKVDYNEKDLETLAKALLKYTVRNPKKQLSLDEYSKELSVKIGSDEDNADILKEILVKIPLYDELEKSLQSGNILEAEKIVCDFFGHPNFEKLIGDLVDAKKNDTEKDNRIKELAKKLKEKEDELLKEKTARETLEKFSGSNINIIIPSINGLDPHLSYKVSELLTKLNENNAFGHESFPKPPQDLNASNLKSWIEKVKFAIQTTGFIADSAAIFHIINQILPYLPK